MRKTITVPDVVFVLNRHGNPIYVSLVEKLSSLTFSDNSQGFDAPFRTRV
jgi:hypothetical protein